MVIHNNPEFFYHLREAVRALSEVDLAEAVKTLPEEGREVIFELAGRILALEEEEEGDINPAISPLRTTDDASAIAIATVTVTPNRSGFIVTPRHKDEEALNEVWEADFASTDGNDGDSDDDGRGLRAPEEMQQQQQQDLQEQHQKYLSSPTPENYQYDTEPPKNTVYRSIQERVSRFERQQRSESRAV